jgi:Flp pilus assembly protein TadG
MKMQRDQDEQAAARRSRHSAASGSVSGKARLSGGRLPARLCRGEEGQSIVEFALASTLFFMMLTGIFSMGIAYSNYQALSQAVGIGGIVLSESRHASTDPCADTFSAITGAAPQLISSKISLSITMNGTTVAGNSCSGAQSDLVTAGGGAGQVSVTATYPCSIGIVGVNAVPNCKLSYSVTEFEY